MTETYTMVRGSAIRMTALEPCGSVPDDVIRYAVSKCVTKVGVGDIIEAANNEVVRDSGDDPALHFVTPPETLGYNVDIEFLKVNPAILALVTGIDPVMDLEDRIIGFDTKMRVKTPAFALEVWSKLIGEACLTITDGAGEGGFGEGAFGEMPFGDFEATGTFTQPRWGYTLFPFLKGGYIPGYEIANGLVSFKVVGAQTRWGTSWGRGPYDLTEEEFTRLPTPVSGNVAWRNLILRSAPPTETEGVAEAIDVVDNGTAANPHPLATGTLDGGAVFTSSGLVEGGRAA